MGRLAGRAVDGCSHLCHVQDVVWQCVCGLLGNDLDEELVDDLATAVDKVGNVTAEEIWVATSQRLRRIRCQTLDATLSLEVVLDEGALALGVDEDEGVVAVAVL